MKFSDLEFKENLMALNRQARVDFPNSYGASIIQGAITYGNEEGLYELAVFKNGSLCYDSGITEDVIGYLDEEGINELLIEIENLKAEKEKR